MIKQQHIPALKVLRACRSLTKRRHMLETGGSVLQKVLREIAYNILKGNLRLTKSQHQRLKKHRAAVRLLAAKKPTTKSRIKVAQKGGFLAALLTPLIAGLASSILS